ncbi:MAG: hypothetical protein ACREDD_11665 [Methylocella sp.]
MSQFNLSFSPLLPWPVLLGFKTPLHALISGHESERASRGLFR